MKSQCSSSGSQGARFRYAVAVLCVVAALGAASLASAEAHQCDVVQGSSVQVQIATQTGEPRWLGPVTGNLKSASSSTLVLSSLVIGPGGIIDADTIDTFIMKEGDMLVANSHATFTPIQGEAPGTNILHLTLTVNGSQSTGAFAGKVGTIEALGIARQFPPNPAFGGPGQTVFELHYKGQICLP